MTMRMVRRILMIVPTMLVASFVVFCLLRVVPGDPVDALATEGGISEERAAMLPTVAALLDPGGALMISLRHGPLPPGRRMFEVGADETLAHAAAAGLVSARAGQFASTRQPHVTWSRLWFNKPP